jgi:hypothetical protein
LAGLIPPLGEIWKPNSSNFVKKYFKETKNNFIVGMVTEIVEQPISDPVELILVDPGKFIKQDDKLSSICINFQMLDQELAHLPIYDGNT